MNIVLFENNESKEPLKISDPRASHIINILKFKAGDVFDAGIINYGTGKAEILKIDTSFLYYSFRSFTAKKENPPADILISLTRPAEAKKILKNISTVGVSRIMVAVSDKTEKSYIHSTLWQNKNYYLYLVEGASQAFVSDVPELLIFDSVDACIKQHVHEYSVKAALDNYEAEQHLAEIPLQKVNVNSRAVLAVGGERGWSSRERELFRKNSFSLYSLGERVLKTETAAAAGLILLYSRYPSYSKPTSDLIN